MIIGLENFIKNKEKYIKYALEGKTFIYPTDTIYGIGGIWDKTLKKIYEIKQRPENKKVSIILPANNIFDFLNKLNLITEDNSNFYELEQIIKNCYKNKEGFTVIIKAKKEFFNQLDKFGKEVYKNQTIGIRYLNHPFQEFVNILNKPFITTSANLSGQANITNINQLPNEIKNKVDIIIDSGELNNKPSQIIDFRENKVKIIKRN